MQFSQSGQVDLVRDRLQAVCIRRHGLFIDMWFKSIPLVYLLSVVAYLFVPTNWYLSIGAYLLVYQPLPIFLISSVGGTEAAAGKRIGKPTTGVRIGKESTPSTARSGQDPTFLFPNRIFQNHARFEYHFAPRYLYQYRSPTFTTASEFEKFTGHKASGCGAGLFILRD